MNQDSQFAAHELASEEVVSRLAADPKTGLSEGTARQRLTEFGPNELQSAPPVPAWRRFLAQFKDALVLLLVAAAGISFVVWAVEQEHGAPYESIVILTIVLLNAIMGFVQEERSEQALAALRAMAAPEATVIRDGQQRRLPTRELVPGDLLLVSEGDAISADARLIESVELQTLEASLTGESTPIQKNTAPVPPQAAVGDRFNMIFSGTSAGSGHGRAVVTSTGMKTELGKIAGLLHTAAAPVTPLQRDLDRTGKQLGLVVLAIAATVVVTLLIIYGIGDARIVVQVLMFGVALAVAAAPEGLAAVVTVVLAMGVQRMAKRGAIVRKLPAVETLGSATIIASDKTGTLTRNEMTVRVMLTAAGRTNLSGTGYAPVGELPADTSDAARQEAQDLLRSASLSNNAHLKEVDGAWSILGDPTEAALLVAARKVGLDPAESAARFPRLAEVPFTSERKRMSTLHQDAERPDTLVIFAKGAPNLLLERCTHERIGDADQPLTPARREQILRETEALAAEALRTLGAAYRTLPSGERPPASSDGFEQDLIFLGVIGMIDPPRPEAQAAVERAKGAGIRPVLITGDHPGTALAIAREVGIPVEGGAVHGEQLEHMSDADLTAAARTASVFARVSPHHKLRIVKALQGNGEIVAMTGDGVNDAPALQTADIGVAMGITGTDVSKQAADLVLTDDNFATIVAAVEEGRAVFDNIRKFLRYLLSSNVGEVLTVFLAVVFAGPLGLSGDGLFVLPLLATQILWINLVTDGAPALALGIDPADPNLMRNPPRPRGEDVINRRMRIGVVLVGIVMAAGTLIVFDAALPGGWIEGTGTLRYGRTMAFTTLVLFQLFNAFNSRSDAQSAFSGIFRNHWLWAAVCFSLVSHLLVLSVPFMQAAFETMPLSLNDWGLCTAVASSVLWIAELAKLVTKPAAESRPPASD